MDNKIDYSLFEKSLKNLEARYNDLKLLKDQPIWIEESVKESVIQRFEIVCDLMWKILRKYLMQILMITDISPSPKVVLREAHINNILPSDVNIWFNYINIRNNTSHDYNGEKAQIALDLMENFIKDVIILYETMSETKWIN